MESVTITLERFLQMNETIDELTKENFKLHHQVENLKIEIFNLENDLKDVVKEVIIGE